MNKEQFAAAAFELAVTRNMHNLTSLDKMLDKAVAFCKEKNIDESVLVNARLAPDMFPFSRQVQIMSDACKGAAARLSGKEVPSFEDTESTFAELKQRVAKTQDFLASCKEEDFANAIETSVELPYFPKALDYYQFFFGLSLPNVYFHLTTAYNILRHNGVVLGKMDYLGDFLS